MIPMHTFFWGGDDRSYYAEMFIDRDICNVNIQYKPQTLYELYDVYRNALGCIGMRYHAVVLQTILNGNNIILDYTETGIGKISGFMAELEADFYKERYINLDDIYKLNRGEFANILSSGERYDYSSNSEELIKKYIEVMF